MNFTVISLYISNDEIIRDVFLLLLHAEKKNQSKIPLKDCMTTVGMGIPSEEKKKDHNLQLNYANKQIWREIEKQMGWIKYMTTKYSNVLRRSTSSTNFDAHFSAQIDNFFIIDWGTKWIWCDHILDTCIIFCISFEIANAMKTLDACFCKRFPRKKNKEFWITQQHAVNMNPFYIGIWREIQFMYSFIEFRSISENILSKQWES